MNFLFSFLIFVASWYLLNLYFDWKRSRDWWKRHPFAYSYILFMKFGRAKNNWAILNSDTLQFHYIKDGFKTRQECIDWINRYFPDGIAQEVWNFNTGKHYFYYQKLCPFNTKPLKKPKVFFNFIFIRIKKGMLNGLRNKRSDSVS